MANLWYSSNFSAFTGFSQIKKKADLLPCWETWKTEQLEKWEDWKIFVMCYHAWCNNRVVRMLGIWSEGCRFEPQLTPATKERKENICQPIVIPGLIKIGNLCAKYWKILNILKNSQQQIFSNSIFISKSSALTWTYYALFNWP